MKAKAGPEKETALGMQRREGAESADGETWRLGRAGGRRTGGVRRGWTWEVWGDSSGTRSPEAAGGEAEGGGGGPAIMAILKMKEKGKKERKG